MHVTTAWWAGTLAVIGLLLLVDLVISARLGHNSTRQSARWVVFYVAVALVFGLVLSLSFGASYGGQFLAGWITEYSLSVDNLFVFLVLMTRFAVPDHLQLRVLTVGVVIALVLRGGLIAVGAVALARFSWLFYIFGAFLIYTAWSMVRSDHQGEAEADSNRADDPKAPEDEPGTVRLLNRLLPNTPVWHGGRLLIRQNGRLLVTPMLLTMLAIGFTDVLFALDSIPAIFGLTQEPFLVVAANAFALIGLRQLFFVVRGLLDTLEHLSKGLSLVLAFIGAKLVLEALHQNSLPFLNGGEHVEWAPEIPTVVSLGVVVGIIAFTALTSMVTSRRRARQEEAGSAAPDGAGGTRGPVGGTVGPVGGTGGPVGPDGGGAGGTERAGTTGPAGTAGTAGTAGAMGTAGTTGTDRDDERGTPWRTRRIATPRRAD
jgi:tellurite resistance protein TerC